MAVYDDPFDLLMEDCHITSSQESDFKHCSYFGPSDRIDTPCPFPPESPDDRVTEIVSHDVDSGTAVDLGRDTDLGFSEMEVDPTQEIEAESNIDGTFCMELQDGVSKRQLSTKSCSEGSKSLDLESPEKSGNVALMKSPKNLTLSPGGTPVLELQNHQNREGSVDGKPEVTVSKKNKKFSVLDLLRQLGEEEDREKNEEFCCLSLLEVAEQRWGRF